MPAFLALLRGLAISTIRNRQGLFWTFFSPLMFMVIFSFFGSVNGTSPLKAYLSTPPGPMGQSVRAVLTRVKVIQLVHESSVSQAMGAVRNGKLNVVLTLSDGPGPRVINAYYDNSNVVEAAQTRGVIAAIVSEVNTVLSGRPPTFGLRLHAVAGQNVTYLDFLVPGIMALMAMNNSLFGLAGTLTRWKEKGVLRRFLATPMKPFAFLGASIVNQLMTGLLSLGIVLGVAEVGLHAHEHLPWLPLTLMLALGVSCFLAVGFLIGGIAKSQEAVMPIINIVAFPMMFLSGVFFPVSTLPLLLRHIVAVLPLTFLVNGVRAMMNAGVTWNHAITIDALGLGGWLVVVALATMRLWQWE